MLNKSFFFILICMLYFCTSCSTDHFDLSPSSHNNSHSDQDSTTVPKVKFNYPQFYKKLQDNLIKADHEIIKEENIRKQKEDAKREQELRDTKALQPSIFRKR